ncbi:MAG: DNA cytosine methyltransferase [Coriobacteriales bacterium]|jgi:DNA (cytosine-5)-methyltransferase 1|nr:DNA cytosine methyltransferase [Coriobacteriales bacterium]
MLGKRWRTVRDAVCDLPDPEGREARRFANHEFKGGARPYAGHSGSALDEPSKTIKAGAHGVPGGENMLVLDDGSLRYYTVRESARIQTFPDDYRFHGSWTESMRQFGNAVPVRLANIIGESVVRQLERAAMRDA